MVQLNKDNKTDVSLLEIQRPLSSELIKDYNHKEAMKDIHDIFLQLEDNYFYQVAFYLFPHQFLPLSKFQDWQL